MREILFRGKRTDTGEWVEGFYAKSGNKTFILIDSDIAVGYVTMKEVLPETVGKFTGATDKNGKKIFEGDLIVERKYVYAIWFGKHNIGCCGCCYQSHQSVGFYISDKDGGEPYSDEHAWEDWCVVGNIFDNPELLECQD